MRRESNIIFYLIIFSLIIGGVFVSADQRNQSNIPSDVKEQIDKLDSPDMAERARSARRLGEMGEKAAPAVPFLIKLLGETVPPGKAIMGPTVSDIAAGALYKIGAPAVELLIDALKKDVDFRIRAYCAETLGDIKDKRAVEPLITALQDKDEWVQMYAAYSLGDIKDIRAIEPLIETLVNCNYADNSRRCDGADSSLKQITGQNFGKNRTKWQEWWMNNKEQFQSSR